MNQVEIYTDGACKGNPGPGGWGVLLQSGATEKELFGGERSTTNNRMELMAVIQALAALKRPCDGHAVRRQPVRAQGHHRVAAGLEGQGLAHREQGSR